MVWAARHYGVLDSARQADAKCLYLALNVSFRRELLAPHLFRFLTHVRQLIDEWMHNYNTQRPYQALNFVTPIEFK